jgi:pimeloyl-ACP methyl ester carboxylesterase
VRFLLLHGLPTGGRYWARLTLPGRVEAPDLVGFGEAPEQRIPGNLDGFLGPLRGLAGPDVCVVGVDFGGVLAAALAAEGLAGRLVLMSTALGAAWLPSRWAAHRPLAWGAYHASGGQLFLRTADATGELARAFPRMPGVAGRMIAVARTLRVREQQHIRAAIRARGVPTLCLWGREDRFLPPAVGRRLARQLGGFYADLPGAHALAWTAADEVVKTITGFNASQK